MKHLGSSKVGGERELVRKEGKISQRKDYLDIIHDILDCRSWNIRLHNSEIQTSEIPSFPKSDKTIIIH